MKLLSVFLVLFLRGEICRTEFRLQYQGDLVGREGQINVNWISDSVHLVKCLIQSLLTRFETNIFEFLDLGKT